MWRHRVTGTCGALSGGDTHTSDPSCDSDDPESLGGEQLNKCNMNSWNKGSSESTMTIRVPAANVDDPTGGTAITQSKSGNQKVVR